MSAKKPYAPKLELARPLPEGIAWCRICQGTMPLAHQHHPRPTLLELAERARRFEALACSEAVPCASCASGAPCGGQP